jgi:hypothetical protein
MIMKHLFVCFFKKNNSLSLFVGQLFTVMVTAGRHDTNIEWGFLYCILLHVTVCYCMLLHDLPESTTWSPLSAPLQ